MRIAREEIFGPVVSVIKCRSERTGRVDHDVAYGLSCSIYTQDINRAFKAMRDVYTGIFYVNAPTIGAEVPPAVRRHEGDGQRASRGGPGRARRVLRVEVDHVDFSGKLQRAQIDTESIWSWGLEVLRS